jgi:formylglycine-generating enzyme required for sulfatase activity
MGFTKIPAGPFLMGSDLGDSATYDDQHPVHEIYLEEYYIARFPVNVIQFKAFVEDSGYEPRDPESLLGVSNHPVVWVNWYDALAYCEWLNDKLRQKAKWVVTQELADRSQYLFWEGLANGKLRVTLPSEAEWEKAARGEDVRIYPWGNEYVLENANVEMNIGKTCAVGCYLDGASPYGVLDMGGNVWEWTRSIYSPYPYDALDGREDIYVNTDVRRVLRGGCWSVDHRFARCTSRYRRKQKYRFNDFGFRVVVSPA